MSHPSKVIVQELSDLIQENWCHIMNLSTVSERQIVKQWFTLPISARCLLLNLHNRSYEWYRKSEIDYWSNPTSLLKDEFEQERILNELCRMSFLKECSRKLRTDVMLERLSVVELKELCKLNNLKVRGKKSTLIQHLSASSIQFERLEPCYLVRHQQLFKRIWTQVLLQHSGTTQSYFMQCYDTVPWRRLSLYRTPTLALHHTRTDYRQYRYWKECSSVQWSMPTPRYQDVHSIQYRFSGCRFWKSALVQQSNWTDPNYQTHCDAHLNQPNPDPLIRHHVALHTLRAGNGRSALTIMNQGLDTPMSLAIQIQYHTSLQYIARRAKKGCLPTPPLQHALERRLKIDTSNLIGNRKSFQGQVLEVGVVDFLKQSGIVAYRTENTPWNALFVLLFFKAIIHPVDNAMPSPIQNLPVDFGLPQFYTHRQTICDHILQDIQDGLALSHFDETLEHFEHPIQEYHFKGVNITEQQLPTLRAFTSIVPSEVLWSIMKWKLISPTDTSRGLPDICIQVSATSKVSNLFPTKIQTGFHFVELKSQSDTLSPYQKAWIHRLISDTCSVEVWNVYS